MEKTQEITKLTAKRLTIPELNKDKRRWNTLLSKLKHNKKFIREDGQIINITNPTIIIESITDNNGNINNEKSNNFFKPNNRYIPIIETNLGSIKLNQLYKSSEFGGGSGISLGSTNARVYETIQALFFSLRQVLNRDITIKDVKLLLNNSDKQKEIFNHVNSTMIINEDDIKYFEDRGWLHTYIKTANTLYDSLNKNKNYTFYHAYNSNGIAHEIYQTFIRIFNDINKTNDVKISLSRWNPSDIWIVETDLEATLISSLKTVKNITELNTIMDTSFDNNYLIGISLKKIAQDSEIKLIVTKTLQTKFTYDYTTTSKGPFDKLTVKIKAKSYSWLGNKKVENLDARTYSGKELGNIFLEVRSNTSKYGKASLNYINSILNRVNIEPIPLYNEITYTNDELKEKIIQYYSNIPTLIKTHTKLSKWNIEKTRSKLISKYQALMLVDKLEKNKKRPYNVSLIGLIKFIFNRKLSITNYIIKEIFYYAYSMGNDIFENTKFYRIKTK